MKRIIRIYLLISGILLSACKQNIKEDAADYQCKPLRLNSLDIEAYHLTNEQRLGLDPILHLGAGIPFYILIDRDGVIVDLGEHMRPSIPETRDVIEKHI